MADRRTPPPPKGLKTPGRRLWRDVVARFELERHEADLLTQACRTLDLIDALDQLVDGEGLMRDGKAHPALVEARQQRITLARLLAALRLPDEEEQRPQRRQIRGVYRGRTNPPAPLEVVS